MQDILRLIAFGSADAGKSTLSEKLLSASRQEFDDQVVAAKKESSRYVTQRDKLDPAQLVDGPSAKREQKFTEDIAYRSFATSRLRFIMADPSEHEQYTRNIAAEASTCDLALLVVDASQGLLIENHRDARIVALLGVRHLVLAVNKMDLVEWDEAAFSRIVEEFSPLVRELGFASYQPVPVSALDGVNVAERPIARPSSWYKGPTLLSILEDVDTSSSGAVTASASSPIELSDQFEARILCLSEQDLVSGRSYQFNLHASQAAATITAIKYQVDVKNGAHLAARTLQLNDIGVVNISLDRPVPFDPSGSSKRQRNFILVDRLTNQTVGAGTIDFPLHRASNIHWQALDIDKAARAGQKLQNPLCLWLTGLSGAGKSTIANLLEKRLFAAGKHTYVLDGDNIRHGLNRDLGFTEADRVENIRRVTEVAKLLVDAGLQVIVAFISPYRAERNSARARFAPGEFYEVFVDAPLEECERRDNKGLYAKARRGELRNFTGIDSDYEPPESPDLHLNTLAENPEECVRRIMMLLESRKKPVH